MSSRRSAAARSSRRSLSGAEMRKSESGSSESKVRAKVFKEFVKGVEVGQLIIPVKRILSREVRFETLDGGVGVRK